jgi:predicted nucleic acid-binding protein
VTGAILDTDVFSILFDDRPQAAKVTALLDGVETALAFPSIAELAHGAEHAGWGIARVDRLREEITRHGLLMPTDGLLWLWGVLRATAVRLGHPLGQQMHANDLWIAACAVHYGVPLVTANERHFAGLPDLEVIAVKR